MTFDEPRKNPSRPDNKSMSGTSALESRFGISNLTLRFSDIKIQKEFVDYLRNEVQAQTCILLAVFSFLSLVTLVIFNTNLASENVKKLL